MFNILKIFSSIATVTLLVSLVAPVLAEDKNAELEEIIVQAPINVQRSELHSASDPMVKTELVELSRQVYIGDLDLSKYADVKVLESRIEQVAQDSCGKLNEMFPLSNRHNKDSKRCVELAIRSAMAEKEAAIEAAQ